MTYAHVKKHLGEASQKLLCSHCSAECRYRAAGNTWKNGKAGARCSDLPFSQPRGIDCLETTVPECNELVALILYFVELIE